MRARIRMSLGAMVHSFNETALCCLLGLDVCSLENLRLLFFFHCLLLSVVECVYVCLCSILFLLVSNSSCAHLKHREPIDRRKTGKIFLMTLVSCTQAEKKILRMRLQSSAHAFFASFYMPLVFAQWT